MLDDDACRNPNLKPLTRLTDAKPLAKRLRILEREVAVLRRENQALGLEASSLRTARDSALAVAVWGHRPKLTE